MRVRVMEYKGFVSIEANFDEIEGLVNDPKQSGQLGYIVRAESIDISKEAHDVLMKIKSSRDCIGDIDIYESYGEKYFSWLGGSLRVIDLSNDISGSNKYKPELLTSFVANNPSLGFKEYIDKNWEK